MIITIIVVFFSTVDAAVVVSLTVVIFVLTGAVHGMAGT